MKLPEIKKKKFTLRPFKESDVDFLQERMNNEEVVRNMSLINYPYTKKDAEEWVEKNLKTYQQKKPEMINFVIDISGELVGSVGFSNFKSHKAELGYWLAKDFWGKGIMTEATKEVSRFGFNELGLVRIYGYVFLRNTGSIRVLEKAGYEKEGLLKKYTEKNGKHIDAYIYARVK